MNPYKIITDSNTDLSPELIEQLGIYVIPMTFTMGNKLYHNYPDERDISNKEFYQLLREGQTAKTDQINSVTFQETFEPFLKEGLDLIYLAFSSGLSGTYNGARLTVEELKSKYPDRKILVVDTLAASMGEGLLVYHAAQLQKQGASIEGVAKWVEENRNRLAHWFTVDDLNHLKRGGRVSGAAALFGTMLGIKPVLHVDDEGHLIPMEKVRGRRQSLDALVKHMAAAVENPQDQVVFISHGDCLEDAEYVAQQVREKFKVQDIAIHYIGPVIGSHSGPGTVALFFLGKNKD